MDTVHGALNGRHRQPMISKGKFFVEKEGEWGRMGVRKPQNRTEIRKKPETASDNFPNTETARSWRLQYRQYESCLQQHF